MKKSEDRNVELERSVGSAKAKKDKRDIVTYHLFSLRVKEGYLVLPRESTGGRYLGSTCSQNRSGRMMTNDRPCGSHVMMSLRDESARISWSL